MNWSELNFKHAEFWWVVPLLVVLVGLGFLLLFLWRARVRERVADPALAARLMETASRPRQIVKAVLVTVAVALLALAALRPQYGVRETEVTNTGIDIAVLLDASQSMLVRDIVPDRFAAARREIERVLEGLTGGRVALIPFYFIPFVQSPLTSDFDALKVYLRDLRLEDIAEPELRGTSIGRALRAAVGLLARDERLLDAAEGEGLLPGLEEYGDVKGYEGSRYKAILLFTDGEEHEEIPEEIYTVAEEAGVRIFAVGVGTRAGHAVPVVQEDGEVTGVLKTEDDQPVFSALNEELLSELSRRTGGAYFHFGARSVAEELLAEIEKLEKKEFEARVEDLGEDRYQFLLVPALLLLLLEGLLSDRHRRRRREDARRERTPRGRGRGRAGATAVLVCCLFASPHARAWEFLKTRQSDVEAGNALIEAGKPQEALEAYERARRALPERPELHFAIGLAHHHMGAHGAAVRAFERALERLPALQGDPTEREQRFAILYALGTAFAAWGGEAEAQALAGTEAPPATDDEDAAGPARDPRALAAERFGRAVHFLERALRVEPTHEGALRNLELALLRVDPPCVLRNDEYAPNDTAETAAALTFPEGQQELDIPLLLCPGEEDWFVLEAARGDRIFASIKGENREADLSLSLYAPDGVRVRPPAQSELRVSELSYQEGALEGPIRLRVVDPMEEESAYRLSLRVMPACARLEDGFEPNDTFEEARLVTAAEREAMAALRLCPRDDDWFMVDVEEGHSLLVIGRFEVEKGTPAIALFDAAQNELARRALPEPEGDAKEEGARPSC
jgi:Ca-activated chloride channel homolog